MKKALIFIFPAVLAMVGVMIPAGAPAQEAKPATVSLAVRVFDGARFVDDLKTGDFELVDDGVPQNIEALYLVKRNAVVRREGEVDFAPDLSRRFHFLFQIFEYQPKLIETIKTLFREELLPGDTLEIQTPVRNYKLNAQAFAQKPKDVLAEEMTSIVKKDIVQGGQAYNSLLSDLKKLVRAVGGSSESLSTLEHDEVESLSDTGLSLLLQHYRETIQKMDALRRIDGGKIAGYARALKSQPGQKFVFFIYQREYRPEIDPMALNSLVSNNQDNPQVLGDVNDLFQNFQKNLIIDIPRIREFFSDSAANFNLLFINKAPEHISRIIMREQSEDIFQAFARVAEASGGLVDTSQNPAQGVRNIMKSAENYYLLYYTPQPPTSINSFRPLKVRVKGGDYKIVHRIGYLVN